MNDYEKFLKNVVNVNFDEANISELERQVLEAARKSDIPKLQKPEIGELAEPIRLNDFLEPFFSALIENTNSLGEATDIYKEDLIDFNNIITGKLDAIDSLIGEATNAINEAVFLDADEGSDFLWVSETFNSTTFIDSSRSNAYVDTDSGKVTLGLQSFQNVPWNVTTNTLNSEELKSRFILPGCNLLALDVQPGSERSEPQVRYEQNNTSEITNLIDGKSNTWFEVEKNFINPNQRLSYQGKALVADNSGEYADVLEKTFGLDWDVSISYPGDSQATKGRVADFVFLKPKNSLLFQKNLAPTDVDTKVPLTVTIDLDEPTLLSNIKIIPLLRPGSDQVVIKQILVHSPSISTPFVVAKDYVVTNNKASSTNIQLEVERKTGLQNSGLNFSVTTNRPISKIEIFFEGDIGSEVKFGHPFFWINVHRRSVRRYFVFDSVDHIDTEKRVPTSSEEKHLIATINSRFSKTQFSTFDQGNLANPGTVIRQEDKPTLEGLGSLFSPLINNLGAKANLPAKIGLKFLDLFKNDIGLGSYSSTDEITATAAGHDVFIGYRSAVAIKEIALERINYAPESVVTSVERSFPEPVNQIGLFADVNIPHNWPIGEWVKFEISFDSGQTWFAIQPLSGQDYSQNLKLDTPVQKFIVRSTIKGRVDDPSTSPEINHYSVRGFNQ